MRPPLGRGDGRDLEWRQHGTPRDATLDHGTIRQRTRRPTVIPKAPVHEWSRAGPSRQSPSWLEDGASGQDLHSSRIGPLPQPRGLRFGPDGDLYCVGRDEVARFDFETGVYGGAIVRLSDLFGQAVEFFD
jgi:hypothetical protein